MKRTSCQRILADLSRENQPSLSVDFKIWTFKMSGYTRMVQKMQAAKARAAAVAAASAPAAAPAAAPASGGAGRAPLMFADDAKAAIVQSAYEYVADPAAMIALLYRTRAVYDACPMGVPSSELGRGFSVNEHFNHPHGMKALNVMLRYTYNYFNDFTKKMNFNDYEARTCCSNAIYFRARDVRNVIASVFATLSDTPSTTKYNTAQSLFNRIKSCITSMPPTPAEREHEHERDREIARRAAVAAAAEEARRAEEAARAKKAADDAFAAANGGKRPEDCW